MATDSKGHVFHGKECLICTRNAWHRTSKGKAWRKQYRKNHKLTDAQKERRRKWDMAYKKRKGYAEKHRGYMKEWYRKKKQEKTKK